MRFLKVYGIFLVLLCTMKMAQAQVTSSSPRVEKKTIELVTWSIPLMVESADKGLFVEVVKEISKRSKKDIKLVVQPAGQALLDFSNNKYQGFFPAHSLSLSKGALHSEAFYTKNDFIFYLKNQRLVSLKDLEGKKVGLTFRYFYDPEILSNKKIRFEYADDDFINMKKLGEGHIDAFIVEERSGQKAIQQSGFANIRFEKGAPISAKSIYFAFENSALGEDLRDTFSRHILEMKKDGTLDRLFSVER